MRLPRPLTTVEWYSCSSGSEGARFFTGSELENIVSEMRDMNKRELTEKPLSVSSVSIALPRVEQDALEFERCSSQQSRALENGRELVLLLTLNPVTPANAEFPDA